MKAAQVKRTAWKANPSVRELVEGHCRDYELGAPIAIKARSVFATLDEGDDPDEMTAYWECWTVKCPNCGEEFYSIIAGEADWEDVCDNCYAAVEWEP